MAWRLLPGIRNISALRANKVFELAADGLRTSTRRRRFKRRNSAPPAVESRFSRRSHASAEPPTPPETFEQVPKRTDRRQQHCVRGVQVFGVRRLLSADARAKGRTAADAARLVGWSQATLYRYTAASGQAASTGETQDAPT